MVRLTCSIERQVTLGEISMNSSSYTMVRFAEGSPVEQDITFSCPDRAYEAASIGRAVAEVIRKACARIQELRKADDDAGGVSALATDGDLKVLGEVLAA